MKNFIYLFLAGALALGACSKDDAEPEPIAVGSVTLNKTELTLHREESETLVATVSPADAADKTVTWHSSDTQVATVSDAGAVAAVEPGTATITASAGGKSAACIVTVEPDIYVVGDKSNPDIKQTKGYLWKNGTVQQLPFREAKSVYVSGKDVYIAGNYYNDAGEFGVASWKNGGMTGLEVGNYNVHSIAVSGGNVYVAGATGGSVAYLWTNGVVSRMEATGDHAAYSVFVSGSDIYVGGNRQNNTADRCATYWKNGAATDLTDGSLYATVWSIVVAKGVVYAAGYEKTADGQKAVLWTDGVATYLPEGTSARSVAVSDKGDVFVVGQGMSRACGVWKNGRFTQLSSDGNAYSVALYGEDVYVAGSNAGATTLWKNGVAANLPEGSYAMSVFVR